MSRVTNRIGVIPASLSFLAIYNPSLCTNDETPYEQIVYYSHGYNEAHKSYQFKSHDETEESREDMNERLRQIGLAQGMIEFAKNFSNGDAVDSIETEKCRILLHELEAGWWILASINVSRVLSSLEGSFLPHPAEQSDHHVEYSAREVSPPDLLLQQLLRAHQIFLLHHSLSLAELYSRLTRSKFCRTLKHFWDNFIFNWDVLLHGNPAVDVFNGVKLAAGGELGVGVGEEKWGSGEREVLEGFIGRTNGLIDILVSRFGDMPHASASVLSSRMQTIKEWHGNSRYIKASDGVVFSGTGAIARLSIKAISSWVEMLYLHGNDAYGVRDDLSTSSRRKRIKPVKSSENQSATKKEGDVLSSQSPSWVKSSVRPAGRSRSSYGIPPPIAVKSKESTADAETNQEQTKCVGLQHECGTDAQAGVDEVPSSTDTLMKILTLGIYGSKWENTSRKTPTRRNISNIQEIEAGERQTSSPSKLRSSSLVEQAPLDGFFMIGLLGDNDQDDADHRITIRTLHVQQVDQKREESSNVSMRITSPINDHSSEQVRVVVYVVRKSHAAAGLCLTHSQQQPFIFTFLFEIATDSLADPMFYRSLHHQLGPLRRPLLVSTSAGIASERLGGAAHLGTTASTGNSRHLQELVYNRTSLTVHTTIPNIPEPDHATATDSDGASMWSRIEALNVHSQILNMYHSTRRLSADVEHCCKTNRGWWVAWMRLPDSPADADPGSNVYGEVFLIRPASDSNPSGGSKLTGRFSRDNGESRAGGRWGPGRLAEGIGIDARQYVETLLNLAR